MNINFLNHLVPELECVKNQSKIFNLIYNMHDNVNDDLKMCKNSLIILWERNIA